MGLAAAQVLRWQLDLEQNCDVFVCVEEWALHTKNIYCMVYSPQLNCLITGSEDNTIHMHYLHSEWGGERQGASAGLSPGAGQRLRAVHGEPAPGLRCTAGAAIRLWDWAQRSTLLRFLQEW